MTRSALQYVVHNGIDLEDVAAVETDPATHIKPANGGHVLYGSDLRLVVTETGMIRKVELTDEPEIDHVRRFEPPRVRGKRGKGRGKLPTSVKAIVQLIEAAEWAIDGHGGGLARVITPSGARYAIPPHKVQGRNLMNFAKALEREGLNVRHV